MPVFSPAAGPTGWVARPQEIPVCIEASVAGGATRSQGTPVCVDAPAVERRTARRVDFEVTVDWTSDDNFYSGLTRDISTGGVFIATTMLRRPGDRIHLKLLLPGISDPFEADAVVRWLREPSAVERSGGLAPGMGVQFVNLQTEQLAAVRRFMAGRDSIYFEME